MPKVPLYIMVKGVDIKYVTKFIPFFPSSELICLLILVRVQMLKEETSAVPVICHHLLGKMVDPLGSNKMRLEDFLINLVGVLTALKNNHFL